MSLYNFVASGNILTKLFPSDVREAEVIKWVCVLEGRSHKIWEGEKNVQNSVRFLITFDFVREYLRNGSTYRQSEEYLINYNPFHVDRKNYVNFGRQTKKLKGLIRAQSTLGGRPCLTENVHVCMTRNTLDCDQSNYSSRIVFSHIPIAFGQKGISAIRSADPENPTVEPKMKWIGRPLAEIWPFEISPIWAK